MNSVCIQNVYRMRHTKQTNKQTKKLASVYTHAYSCRNIHSYSCSYNYSPNGKLIFLSFYLYIHIFNPIHPGPSKMYFSFCCPVPEEFHRRLPRLFHTASSSSLSADADYLNIRVVEETVFVLLWLIDR